MTSGYESYIVNWGENFFYFSYAIKPIKCTRVFNLHSFYVFFLIVIYYFILLPFQIKMNLIANSMYILHADGVSVEVGLNPLRSYMASIIISQLEGASCSITLDTSSFIELNKLAVEITSSFSNTETLLENDIVKPLQIGKYQVTVLKKYKIVRFIKEKCLFFEISKGLDLTFDAFSIIFNLSVTIHYKLRQIELYSTYARHTHSRIINFFIHKLVKEENFNTFQSQTLEVFKVSLIELPEKNLPQHFLEMRNFEHLDVLFCELIDSEIRSLGHEVIFGQLKSILESIKSFKNVLEWYE